MTKEEKMLKNFVEKYGIDGLRQLMIYLLAQASNELIAKHFSVTRQRVHQWQKAFTVTQVIISPQIQEKIKQYLGD